MTQSRKTYKTPSCACIGTFPAYCIAGVAQVQHGLIKDARHDINILSEIATPSPILAKSCISVSIVTVPRKIKWYSTTTAYMTPTRYSRDFLFILIKCFRAKPSDMTHPDRKNPHKHQRYCPQLYLQPDLFTR